MAGGKPRITVIGAGPVGALIGVFLARRGFQVELFERRPDMRRVDIPAGRSINLALANRGIDALQRLGLMERVSAELIPMRGRMIHHEDGTPSLQPYGNKPHEVIHSVSRNALNRILLDAAEDAGAKLRFGRRCEELDFARRGLRMADEDGGGAGEQEFEVLIGADGSGSVVRRAVIDAAGGEVREEGLDHGYKELTVPPGPDGGFVMEPNALHIWPRGGYMLIALPNRDCSFTATLFLPEDGEASFTALCDAASVEEFFRRNFPDAVPLIAGLSRDFFANPTGRLGTVRCRPWHWRGEVVLIGDAAHAVVPFHGQGMNAGFEDCVALDRWIAEGGDWRAAFAAFEAERRPNAEAIADMALENYVEMRDSVRTPRFQLKKALAWALEERFPDAFVPRYSMVMFHLLPYAEARARGAVQEEILDRLTQTADRIENVDFGLAARLIAERLR